VKLLLPAVLLLGAAAADGPPGTPLAPGEPPAGGWVVVRKDGARVTFEAPPRTEGGRLVGRLRGSGTLVSLPAARVDAEATARANAPGAPAVAASPATAAPTPRPFETPPLGQRVRLTMSAEEARRHLEEARTGTPDPGPPPGETAAPAPVPEEAGATDRTGRDESWWRERAAAARGAAEESAAALAAAEAALEAAERSFLGGSEAERTTFVVNVLDARNRAEAARAEHARARTRWEALQEEARKAGALPGWLR
jgi:hypothetical protein